MSVRLPSCLPSRTFVPFVLTLFLTPAISAIPAIPGSPDLYSFQSAMKMFVSWGLDWFRFDDHTSFFPSELNMGNPSNAG